MPQRYTETRVPYDCYTCQPVEVTFPPLSQPALVFNLAITEGCKAELSWLGYITYQGDVRARRRSPIPVLTGLDVE